MESREAIRPPGSRIQVKLIGDRVWAFKFPSIKWEELERLHEGIELYWDGELNLAEGLLEGLSREYPEFVDAHHHLALVLDATGREGEAFALWQEVVAMGLDCLPAEFEMGDDLLPWLELDNRPFLRAYHALGVTYLDRGDLEKALEIFINCLALNPNDNQGVRALVVDCLFRLGRPDEVLTLCDRYPDDLMEGLIYGRPLALFQLGRRDKADEALSEAISSLPLVAEELVKSSHRKPRGLRPDRITLGGEAYAYWVEQGEHWIGTEGAREFVRANLRKLPREKGR